MEIKKEIPRVLIVAVVLFLIDLLYLSTLGAKPFVNMVSKIQNKAVKVNLFSAGFTYILLIAALYFFIIKNNLGYWEAFLLGFIIYGVFDFTNMALFSNYDLMIGIQDTVWGGTLFVISLFIYKKIVDVLKV